MAKPLKHMDYHPSVPCCRGTDEIICGIDEVGRGCIAGPVYAAAVSFRTRDLPLGINDSKKLSAKRRETLYPQIMSCAHVGIGIATVEEIDRYNILEATFLAMRRAFGNLPLRPKIVLVDGPLDPGIGQRGYNVITHDGLDGYCPTVAAASIVAKTVRDALMTDLAMEFPHYDWASNKGYGTKKHQDGLRSHGFTDHHRRSFSPVKEMARAAA
ncbi:ribonuclease HII [Sphingomonas sp. 3-13AW]|uniref:ribonuclease HII n=1 Tax=Sphingomonas sp. 3-13AW TaxID=3050450 RepID=UPI003BB6D3B9